MVTRQVAWRLCLRRRGSAGACRRANSLELATWLQGALRRPKLIARVGWSDTDRSKLTASSVEARRLAGRAFTGVRGSAAAARLDIVVAAAVTAQVDVLYIARRRRSHAAVNASTSGCVLAILPCGVHGVATFWSTNAVGVRGCARDRTVAIALGTTPGLRWAICVAAASEHANACLRADRL
jgi:hypothetical protein